MTALFIFTWDGEAMIPLPRMAKACDREFVVGEQYRLEVHEERSAKSHSHYFACVGEAWKNLPENLAEHFPSPDHLRKFALIKRGFFDERSVVCATPQEAERVAAFVKPMDDYAVISASGAMVQVFTAKSQSVRAMGKREFQTSKDAVLEYLSALIGVELGALSHRARNAEAA